MTLLSLNNVAIRYGATTILQNVSFTIARDDRWGIVGRNGAGKTSILEVLTGDVTPSEGTIVKASGVKVAVLDQLRTFDDADTVWDAAAGAFRDLRRIEQTLNEQTVLMSEQGADVDPKLLEDYSKNLERFEHQGGYAVTAKVDAILDGLGFDSAKARTQLADTLSGGERGRVGLAAQLATGADILLLDEPTNHLDLAGTRWLENYLKTANQAVVVISHDRAFLDAVTDHTLHLEAGTATTYPGSYQTFVTLRAERRLTAERAYDKQSRALAREEDYIRRNTAGHNATNARGRLRRLARVERLTPPPTDSGAMAVRFQAANRGGDQVMVVDRIGVDLDDRTLLREHSSTIRRGDVVGLIGPNGTGKSTLLSVLLGQRSSSRGEARLGDSIEVGYYRQDLGDIDLEKSLYDIVHDLRPSWNRGQIQDHLGRLGFSGDSVKRSADGLSGGEMARMAIGRLMLSGANFLVFDEPTNHLDVETIEALEDAIAEFDGTVLLVSHDRALLRALTTRVWSLVDGEIEDFPGNFEEWEARNDQRAALAAARELEARESARLKERRRREQPSDGPRPITAARRTLESAEALATGLESEVQRLEAELALAPSFGSKDAVRRAAELAARLQESKVALNRAIEAWERASEELARLEGADRNRS